MMADVLRRLGGSELLAEHSALAATVDHAEGRTACRHAFDAQPAFLDAHRAASQRVPRHRSG